jgi:hypothetical protein
MSMHFTIIPQLARTAAPGDLLLTTVVNRSQFSTAARLAVDGTLGASRVVSTSSFPTHDRLVAGAADTDLAQTRVASTSTFPGAEMQEAPPDENLVLTRVASTTAVHTAVLAPEESDDDDTGEGIAVGPPGGMI